MSTGPEGCSRWAWPIPARFQAQTPSQVLWPPERCRLPRKSGTDGAHRQNGDDGDGQADPDDAKPKILTILGDADRVAQPADKQQCPAAMEEDAPRAETLGEAHQDQRQRH